MASFWKTSAGVEATGEVKEVAGFDPLPRAWYKVMFEEATVREWEGIKSVNLKTRVIGECPHKNRVVFLKLKCWDAEDKTRDSAINKATKISTTLGVAQPKHEPDDEYFSQWVDKPLDLLLEVWEFNDKTGNWIMNIDTKGAQSGVKAGSEPANVALKKPNAVPPKAAQSTEDMDDDIPF